MLSVMEEIQNKTLGGNPVLARRKASATSAVPIDPAPLWITPLPPKRKRRVRTRKKKGKSKGDTAKTEPNTNDSGESATTASKHSPPTLGEDEFPTLQDKQVEWETPNELEGNGMESDKDASEDNRKSIKTMSDVASTATTTSSSTESTPHGKKNWGYAAALMKQVPPAVNENTPAALPSESDIQTLSLDDKVPSPVVNVPTATWGGSNSFASVLRKDDQSKSSS